MLCGSADHPTELEGCTITDPIECPECTLNLHTYPVDENEKHYVFYCMNCTHRWEVRKNANH